MARLAGKVAVITGGSSGIGLATAQRFVDEGAHVFIMGRRRGELDKVKTLIGDGLSTLAGDVTNSAHLDMLFATVLDTKGGLDILVANSARTSEASDNAPPWEHCLTQITAHRGPSGIRHQCQHS